MCEISPCRKRSVWLKAAAITLVALLCWPAIGPGLGQGGGALAQGIGASAITVPSSPAMPQSAYLAEKWKAGGLFGEWIGLANINVLDLDGDGTTEVLVNGNASRWSTGHMFWYILSYDPATITYEQEWISRPYLDGWISKIVVGNGAGDERLEIYVAQDNGNIEVYDAVSRSLLHKFASGVAELTGVTLADVDGDGGQEIVLCSSSQIAVYNAQTYEQEWQTTSAGGDEVAVDNVDADPSPEIVTTRYVIDGTSHTVEWDYDSFGITIELADIDDDGMAEIVAAQEWNNILAYDADTHLIKWNLPTATNLYALRVGDVDDDGVQEVLYADEQFGALHCYDSVTLIQEWHIDNPESSVTNIDYGDTDGDGQVEVLWAVGWSTTGPDYLLVCDVATASIEWQNTDLTSPLSAMDVGDVDSDGTQEIAMVSWKSDAAYNDGIILVYNAETRELEWQSDPVMGGDSIQGTYSLRIGDVDDDGTMEIVIATDDALRGIIKAYDGITHAVDWQTTASVGTISAMTIADADADGRLEALGGTSYSEVCLFDGQTGTEKWCTPQQGFGGQLYNIIVADSDADGNPEIIFSRNGGSVYVYDGVTQSQEWVSSLSDVLATAALDVDQDGVQEILIGTDTGGLYAYDGQTYVQEWSASVSALPITSLRVADLNQDGSLEILLADEQYLLALDAGTRDLIWQSDVMGLLVGYGDHLVIRDIDRDTRIEVTFGCSYAVHVFAVDLVSYGPTMQVDRALARPGEPLDYALGLLSFSSSTTTLSVSDPLPTDTLYLDGSLWASKGTYGLVGSTVFWTVTLEPAEQVSLTFAVSVGLGVADGSEIVNTAIYSDGAIQSSRSVSTVVDARPPESAILHPLPGEIVSGPSYSIEGTASDRLAGVDLVQVRIGQGGWQAANGTTNWTYSWTLPLTDSEVTIGARATDGLGWVETPGPSVTVLVDNLPPYLVATVPAHGSTGVFLNQPIVIEANEPVLSETLHLVCQPDPGGWSIESSPDGRTLTLSHNPFLPGQVYSLFVAQLEDRAGHALAGGPTPNPWGFTTGQGPCTPIETVGIAGPSLLEVDQAGLYTATFTPLTATLPVTLTWDNGSSGPTAAYSWTAPGVHTVTVAARNSCSELQGSIAVQVLCRPVEGVTIFGPSQLATRETGSYTATFTPLTATLPITLTWDNGSSGPTADYSWALPGTYTVSVTVTNPCGEVVEEFPVEVVAVFKIYLPLIERGA